MSDFVEFDEWEPIDAPPAEEIPAPKLHSLFRITARVRESAEVAAREWNVDPAQVLAAMPDSYFYLKSEYGVMEDARVSAVKQTKLNSRRCWQWEESGRDYSTFPRFDETAQELAIEFPELGCDPDSIDTPGYIWELIKAGKPEPLLQSSPKVAEFAAKLVYRTYGPLAAEIEPEPVTEEILSPPVIGEPLAEESFHAERLDADHDRTSDTPVRASDDIPPQFAPGSREQSRGDSRQAELPEMRSVSATTRIHQSRDNRFHSVAMSIMRRIRNPVGRGCRIGLRRVQRNRDCATRTGLTGLPRNCCRVRDGPLVVSA